MNNVIYIERNRNSSKRIADFIRRFGLVPCYKSKQETVLKRENLILTLKKKYIILNVLSPQSQVISEVQNFFQV